MQSRDRVICSLNHQEPDRVPWDCWMTKEVEDQLIKYLRLPDKETLLKYFDVDFRYYNGPSYLGKPFKTYDDGTVEDIWGVPRKNMTVDGGAYRWTYSHVVSSPFQNAQTINDIEAYDNWPSADWWDYSNVEENCRQFNGYAVVYAGDRLDRTAQLKPAMYLRGMEQIYVDLYENPGIAKAIFSKIREYFLAYNEQTFKAANGSIDIFMMGDDFGTQNGPMFSADTWRKYFKDGFKQYIELAHKYGIRVMHHTCGSVKNLIPDFIDCGLDILQSLQPRAEGMDLEQLKKEYGKYISFHGSIDIQDTLPHGTKEDIRTEVRNRMNVGKPGGGFIISTAHNIQPDTRLENVLTLFEAHREFGSYS